MRAFWGPYSGPLFWESTTGPCPDLPPTCPCCAKSCNAWALHRPQPAMSCSTASVSACPDMGLEFWELGPLSSKPNCSCSSECCNGAKPCKITSFQKHVDVKSSNPEPLKSSYTSSNVCRPSFKLPVRPHN